jgi:type III secretion system FlhB-like substrate exporter
MVEEEADDDFPDETYDTVDEVVYVLEDTAEEIAGRIIQAAHKYDVIAPHRAWGACALEAGS